MVFFDQANELLLIEQIANQRAVRQTDTQSETYAFNSVTAEGGAGANVWALELELALVWPSEWESPSAEDSGSRLEWGLELIGPKI